MPSLTSKLHGCMSWIPVSLLPLPFLKLVTEKSSLQVAEYHVYGYWWLFVLSKQGPTER